MRTYISVRSSRPPDTHQKDDRRKKAREMDVYMYMRLDGMAGEIANIPSRLGVLYRGYDNNNSNNNGSASRVESRGDADEWVSGLGLQKNVEAGV